VNICEEQIYIEQHLKKRKNYTESGGGGVVSQLGGLYPPGGCTNITGVPQGALPRCRESTFWDGPSCV